jgi:Holliday junction resolvase
MNSRDKGKRGERLWRDELRAQGYAARRGQQFCGSPDSPDVICEQLRWIHFEVKAVEKLNIWDAMDQAHSECGQAVPIVAHKRNFRSWLVTMEAETFFKFLALACGPNGLPPEEFLREQGAPGDSNRK